MSDNDPPVGCMYLYNDITPPLLDGSYRVTVGTDVAVDGEPSHIPPITRHFNVEGPRFTLAPTEVAMVHPPRNGHGEFDDSVPQIALYRRTLPWERPLDEHKKINVPLTEDLGIGGATPWVALLLFQEGEYEILQNVSLRDVIPADVLGRLEADGGIQCDAVEAERALLLDILPSKPEVQLLAHVRQVNVNDRELSASSRDGFFAVVMSNRLPTKGAKHRACLVSLEERWDLVKGTTPPIDVPVVERDPLWPGLGSPELAMVAPPGSSFALPRVVAHARANGRASGRAISTRARLVLLHSWVFESDGDGTFKQLMSGLDVGLIGKKSGKYPAITDTGHIHVPLDGRAGVVEDVVYRGPLVPWPLTRDPLGPYHSADQARRPAPEVGVEDVSYAAAFEAGRLLAAADPRFAQEVMRWRRGAYSTSCRAEVIAKIKVQLSFPLALTPLLPLSLAPVFAAGTMVRMLRGAGPLVDPTDLARLSGAAGLLPDVVREAWGLGSLDDARGVLSGHGALGKQVEMTEITLRKNTTLAEVARDATSFDALKSARTRLVNAAADKAGRV